MGIITATMMKGMNILWVLTNVPKIALIFQFRRQITQFCGHV
nr:MAG TPA: hypothetical protein [Caudoviricetes sp.]